MLNHLVSLLQKFNVITPDLVASRLYNEGTFYKQFVKDLKACKKEVIIESPFISSQRMCTLRRTFEELVGKKVKVYVITRDPLDHDLSMQRQALEEIRIFQTVGVQVIVNSEFNHRKIAILDRKVLWEGSLNILSQSYSQEIMRRIGSKALTAEMFTFLKLEKFIY